MAVSDWVSNLYQSEQTRGLSGGASPAVTLDDANPYYNYKLRRHRTVGDLVADPTLMWYTSSFVESRDGLGMHLLADHGSGSAGFTDVLLILSESDYKRANADDDPGQESWMSRATRLLLSSFDDYCNSEGFSLRFPHRRLGFRLLCDGSPHMNGQRLGLQPGEFVTGLLPNLYTGPVKGSYPVVSLHINLPGAWEGYREVGRLYNDQVLFTLGSSWLDNVSHPKFREAALYRLRRGDDGQFIHIINPDLQDQFQLTSTKQGDASVLTLATRGGEPIAYMVLALIEPPEHADEGIAAPMLIDNQVQRVSSNNARTILPEAPTERIFTFQERGALFQKVHFRKFMEGYDVYLGARGELGTVVDEKAATFQIRRTEILLLAHTEGIEVAGRPAPVGTPVSLDGDCEINALGQRLEYHDLRGCKVEKWPYVAEIRRPASSNYMMWGKSYNIGRALDARVVLPDNPNNRNIHWRPEVGAGATIKSKNGEIEKSRFYTDSIMVASNHVEIDLSTSEPSIICTARSCFVYVRRYGAVFPLYPAGSGKQPTEMTVEPGDEILIGNSVFHVGYTPEEEGITPAPAPSLDAVEYDEAEESPTQIFSSPARAAEAAGMLVDDDDQLGQPGDELAGAVFAEDDESDLLIGRSEPTDKPAVIFDETGSSSAVDWEEGDSCETPSATPKPPPAPVVDSGQPQSAISTLPPQEAKPPPPPQEQPPPPPASPPPAPAADRVLFVDENDAKFELAREVHLVHTGWSVVGELTLGNHTGADLVLPENRIDPDQSFKKVDYFTLKVRGRRTSMVVLAAQEFLFDEADVDAASFDDLIDIPIDVIRRDDEGEEDFAVRMAVLDDPSLPNPRARYLAIDTLDKLTQALITKGLPLNQGRQLELADIRLTATTDGERVTISDYLDTYRKSDGSFEPFFVQHGTEPFKTAPEDGSPIVLDHDDRLLIGHALYLVQRR